MWPGFVEGRHHTEIADKFNKIAKGKLKRLIINMPPGIQNLNLLLTSSCMDGWKISKLKIIQTHIPRSSLYGSVEKQKV